eukprot:gene13908-16440_t
MAALRGLLNMPPPTEGATSSRAGDTAAALRAAKNSATRAVLAERRFWEGIGSRDAMHSASALQAARSAVLEQLEQEARRWQNVESQLEAMHSECEELEKMAMKMLRGEAKEVASRLQEASRAVKKLRRQRRRAQDNLEEALEDARGVAERRAQVDEAESQLRQAEGQLRAAMCELSALEWHFPEMAGYMQQAVPPELITLWRPDLQLEDFSSVIIQPRSGGRHDVAKVTDREGRQFAVKLYLVTDNDVDALKVFWKEVSLLHRLRHPAIVPILAIFVSRRGGSAAEYSIQMPWYEGGQLDKWVSSQQPDEAAMRRAMLQVLEAVAHMHHARVVHCDIKPANILVDGVGRPHLLDFDISVDCRSSASGIPKDPRGTHGYIAPEMAQTGPTTATDMYAFGMTMRAVSPVEAQRGTELRTLLQGLTEEDPARRLSAVEACQHPYFLEGALACQSPDYTDAELCYHLPLEDYQYYVRIRQRRMEEAMTREMEARRLDELKSV